MGSTLEEQELQTRLGKETYERHKKLYTAEKNRPSYTKPYGVDTVNKYFRKGFDHVDKFLSKVLPVGKATKEVGRARRKARKEVWGYEEGGSVTKDLRRNDGGMAKKTRVF